MFLQPMHLKTDNRWVKIKIWVIQKITENEQYSIREEKKTLEETYRVIGM